MLTEKELQRYADVLMWALDHARKRPVKKGHTVRIAFETPAIRLAELLYERIVKRGCNAVTRLVSTPAMEHAFYRFAGKGQLSFVPAGTREFNSDLHGSIHLMAPESLTHLRDVDPKRIGTFVVANKPFREILWRREEKGDFGWTLGSLPTPALAEKSGLSLYAYGRQIVKACYLDRPDPIAEWERISRAGAKIKEWLKSLAITTLRIRSATMDLSISLGARRRFVGLSGHNIPSFEIFTSPDWRGTNGVYTANLPSYYNGNYVEGVRLTFKNGRATGINAKKGGAFVRKMLAMDKTACQVGEFSLTDSRFSRIDKFMAETLYDENHGGRFGNCHIAVGSSYTDAFDGNPALLTKTKKAELGFNDSALHWDLVNTEPKTVTASTPKGEIVIYRDGRFTLD